MLLISVPVSYAAAPEPNGQCVVLVHGLRQTSESMSMVEASLLAEGYTVINRSYPSTSAPIERLSVAIGEGAGECAAQEGAARIHFVTHSLGGILLRSYLKDGAVERLGRIVMLVPPNKGSEVSDFFMNFFLYRRLYGPAGQQLGTGPESVPNTLGPVTAEVGVIAADLSFEPWSFIIPGDDDGKVSVMSARLAGMKDFILVRATHRSILKNSWAIEQVKNFLKEGSFIKTGR